MVVSPPKMFRVKKMYKGRNPSPPEGDFDYRSRVDPQGLEGAIIRLKAMKTNVVFPDLDFLRLALERSLKVTSVLKAKNQDQDPECNNHSSEENSKHKDVLNGLKSLQVSGNFKTLPPLKPDSEKISNENREDDLEAAFLRNKEHEIKENSFDHSSTKGFEYSSDDSSRKKIPEGRRDSTEKRKHQKKRHAEKKKELEPRKKWTYTDELEAYVRVKDRRKEKVSSDGSSSDEHSQRSYKYRSSKRGGQSKSYGVSRRKRRYSSRSSDGCSDHSYKSRSYRRDRRSRSKDRVSRKKLRDSSDSSREYSPKNRSHRRDERRSKERVSRSKERVSRKTLRESSYSSDNCSVYSNKNRSTKREESTKRIDQHKESTHSDSNVSAKATPKSLQEVISEDISAGLSIEDFKNESPRASEVIREERPDSPQRNQTKLSPRSEYDNSYDPDEELSTGAFFGSSSFYCKVCQKNLNGIACYETHMNGKKHKKAENAYKLRSEVSSFDNVADGNHAKEPLVNPGPLLLTKDRDIIQSFETALFQEVIDKYSEEPIQGLEYIDEIYDTENVITYYCNLCDAKCVQNSIFSHLIGSKHGMKFLKKVDPNTYYRIRGLHKNEATKKVREKLHIYEKKYGRQQIKVKRIVKKDPEQIPSDAADGSIPMNEEIKLNPADYLDPSGNYFCRICNAFMNNENMLHMHMVGKRHLKNVKKTSSGLVPSTPNSSSKTKKVPNARAKLEDKLKHYAGTAPIVGLNFIRETQNINGESYICFICNSCTSKDIIDHITSMKHQIKYLETVDANGTIPNGIKHIRELDFNEQSRYELVVDECRRIEEKHGRGKVEVYR